MKRKYYLITNISGQQYWSYKGNKYNTNGFLLDAVLKYGDIYINSKGGWFPKDCIKTIDKIIESENFPQLIS